MATGTSFSLYLENAILNGTLRNTAYTPAATVYAALFTVTPGEGDASGVPGGTEVTGGSYARTAVTFGAPSGGIASNSGTVTFPTATAGWGTIVAVAIMDASTSGHMLFWGLLSANQTINTSGVFSFAAGDLSLQLD